MVTEYTVEGLLFQHWIWKDWYDSVLVSPYE